MPPCFQEPHHHPSSRVAQILLRPTCHHLSSTNKLESKEPFLSVKPFNAPVWCLGLTALANASPPFCARSESRARNETGFVLRQTSSKSTGLAMPTHRGTRRSQRAPRMAIQITSVRFPSSEMTSESICNSQDRCPGTIVNCGLGVR